MNIWKMIFNEKITENGARAYKALNTDMLTLFAQIGSLRKRSEEEIIELYEMAYNENPDLAVKMLFYAGDIRGGLGERRTFRILLNWLALNNPKVVIANFENIGAYNRWDSIYVLINTPVEYALWKYVKDRLFKDTLLAYNGKGISLLAKWLKSANSHNKTTAALGKYTAKKLGYTKREYRQILSSLRNYINIVETNLSKKKYSNINYSAVPSRAMLNYYNAFYRHDERRFKLYLEDVVKGREKINSGVLYPYDIVERYGFPYYPSSKNIVLEEQWKALPNYLDGNESVLCMCDVSGSMWGRPICSSVGLSVYFAQRNRGAFHNKFMTFSTTPSLVSIRENSNSSLLEILKDIRNMKIGYSTNLEAAFDCLLSFSVKYNVRNDEMPKALIIISDNEIDQFKSSRALDFMAEMEQRYNEYGYELPKLIFFQVEARQSTFLTLNEKALFISGNSTASFKSVIDGINMTATEMMLNTLNNARYDAIILPSHF